MLKNIKLGIFLKTSIAVLICFSVSFLNYLLTQIVGGYFFTLTSLAIFYCFIFNCQIPAVLIFLMGLIDDILLNSVLGTYALLYSLIAYFLNLDLNLNQKKILNIIAIAVFLLVNYITFCSV